MQLKNIIYNMILEVLVSYVPGFIEEESLSFNISKCCTEHWKWPFVKEVRFSFV